MRLVSPYCLKLYKLIIFMFFILKIRTLVSKSPRKNPLKFILLWPNKINFPYFGTGQRQFLRDKCSFKNCYVTDHRNMFSGELNNFHAILFDGSQQREWGIFPKKRYPHQKYVYVNFESSAGYPICHKYFNGIFNWTLTYKLNSDFPFVYFHVLNAYGTTIGPKKNMTWIKPDNFYSDAVTTYVYRNKTKAVAWFVSNCRREGVTYARKLKVALKEMNLGLDIYGRCGKLKCPKSESDRCDAMLANDYYFYLAFENTIAKDYVTEKVYRALANEVVPIVYGGANYTMFLPPDSYINARIYSPGQLAYLLSYLINTPEEYQKYFNWKRYYSFCIGDNSLTSNRTKDFCTGEASTLCQLCEALNNPEKFGRASVVNDIRTWWNPDYKKKC